jgi:hypothetical protein
MKQSEIEKPQSHENLESAGLHRDYGKDLFSGVLASPLFVPLIKQY